MGLFLIYKCPLYNVFFSGIVNPLNGYALIEQGTGFGNQLFIGKVLQGNGFTRTLGHATATALTPGRINDGVSLTTDVGNMVGTGANTGQTNGTAIGIDHGRNTAHPDGILAQHG
jgi:hypothetical protein